MARFAYTDPPYIGQARKHYSHDERCAEVNHRVLLGYLCEHFDGWALSCSSSSLQQILRLDTCPASVRIGAWTKPFCAFKPNVNPAYAWEPVLFWNPKKRSRQVPTVRDFISENMTLQKGLSGAKPVRFCRWVIECLGLEPTDELVDVFPGTQIMTHVFEAYRGNLLPKRKSVERDLFT